eukprot:Plantae.Rhodophyta-Purpureofilum_apyrenoidigerum.ctg24658.p1 GENE.Plantae.Rhodophyta-Purpureofilum_apyrenoidigerum.ctg24658~~Plantae.Rhodophyta-Purpureofilum_apyrenoidigerum.ctg24658.p1  ORF type:complete len:363 (+),score=74.04 Plantae.Rhodophyta-Purpureofilum_apyrenoidigerum.ctg24658:303-1391(+)
MESTWMICDRSSRQRFEEDFEYTLGNGQKLFLEQGGNAKDVGQTAWDGGMVLAKYIEHAVGTGLLCFEGKTILDLGSGTGFVGLVCAVLGANVILTDLPGAVTSLMERNRDKNSHLYEASAVNVMPLDWTKPADIEAVLQQHPKIDLIIAAECIYIEPLVLPLINTIEKLSVGSRADVLLSHGVHRLTPLISFFHELRRIGARIQRVSDKEKHPAYRAAGLHIQKIKMNGSVVQNVDIASEKQLIALEEMNERAVKSLEAFLRLEYSFYDSARAIDESDAFFNQLVGLQLEKAKLVERLGALEALTAELICDAHEKISKERRRTEANKTKSNEDGDDQDFADIESRRTAIEMHVRSVLASRV